MRVSEIRVKRIRVNQGLGVYRLNLVVAPEQVPVFPFFLPTNKDLRENTFQCTSKFKVRHASFGVAVNLVLSTQNLENIDCTVV